VTTDGGGGGRSSCPSCLGLEVELCDAINRYAISVGGDPARHVYGNIPRMQAVGGVGTAISALVDKHGAAAAAAAAGAHGAPSMTASLFANPDCTGTVGKTSLVCGEGGYCSDRCWTIARLRASREQTVEYERQLTQPCGESPRRIYVRFPSTRRWCVPLRAVIGGSIETHCKGRAPQSESVFVSTDPPVDDRCTACEMAASRARGGDG
jgi:hypothetical protein